LTIKHLEQEFCISCNCEPAYIMFM